MAVNRTFIGNIKGKQGDKGATGAKIISQVLQGQDENGGYIYLQTYDDGTTQTFVAPRGATGEMGLAGADGKTPFIGENGNWFIGEQDTGVKAQGKDGTNGVDGQNGVGISEVISGESYVEGENTVTPITFKKTDGSENIVNVIAKNGVGGEGGTTNLLSEPIIISNKLSDDTFEKEVNNFGLELGKEYTGVFYGTSSDFPYQGQPSVFTDVGASYLPYELPSGSYILEQFTGAISVFIYVNAKKENDVLLYNEGTTFIKVMDSYAENEIIFESITEAKPEYATVDSLNEVNGKVLSLEQSLKEVTQENVLGTIDVSPDENNQLIKNIEALNIKLNTEYTVKIITWGIGTEELTLSAFAQTGSQAGLDNDESYTLTFTLNNGQLIIYDKSKNVDGRIIYDENSAVIQCQGNDISELTLLSLTAPKSFASKEEVEALGERVTALEEGGIELGGEPLVLTFDTGYSDRVLRAKNLTGATAVDWGDGVIEDISNLTEYSHTYTTTNTYVVKFYGVEHIGQQAFYNNTKIITVHIPNVVRSIGVSAFKGCNALRGVTLGVSIYSIGDDAFNGCTKLFTIVVPSNVRSMSGNIFANSGLREITFLGLPPTIQSYQAIVPSTTKIIVPSTLLSNYQSNSTWQSYLSQIDTYALSSELENLGGSSTPSGEPLVATFNITTASTSVTVTNLTGATMVDWGDGSDIEDISSVTTYTHTYANTGTFEARFYGNITEIGEGAFYRQSLRAITIPISVTSLGVAAFRESGIRSVTIPSSVLTIGERAFQSSSIREVYIQYGVTNFGNSVFTDCLSLGNVALPSSITSLGYNVFHNCIKLKTIEFTGSVPTMEDMDWHYNFYYATQIIVPYKYLNAYKTATNWSAYASQIDAYAMASDIDNINTELTNIIEGEGV